MRGDLEDMLTTNNLPKAVVFLGIQPVRALDDLTPICCGGAVQIPLTREAIPG